MEMVWESVEMAWESVAVFTREKSDMGDRARQTVVFVEAAVCRGRFGQREAAQSMTNQGGG